MSVAAIHATYSDYCQQREQRGQLRRLTPYTPLPNGRVRDADGRELINFSSNNYLGLAHHPLLIQRAAEWTQQYGAGATAARLVCGDLPPMAAIEAKLARGKRSEAALLLGAGYLANAALLPALLDKRVLGAEPLVFCDRLNHASMHQGCVTAGVRQIRYRHNDLDHLRALLEKHADSDAAKFILSESVFSMDGDRADMAGLIAIKEQYGAFLYIDEAHATGVLGPDGFGLSAQWPGRVDLAMGTFSKGLGGFGAYAACSAALRAYLINAAGGFIYATAPPPAVLGAMDAALDLLPQLADQRQRLQAGSDGLRAQFTAAGLDVGASTTPIIPVIVGGEAQALALAEALKQAGMLGVAIRPPTVPKGASRVRLTLSAAHDDADWAKLGEILPRLASAI
ncbi:aminotransferase class I/II-fold pyridoxal phosphate-dependent enzyme [Magnetofaba australis]|uniref:8-amino-7-oxononanoate synthase n=1 Tax=Magnetofaba australis IT-1 TaxID=1434232 RepID=A0A1Y2K076_9PROT|nr:aminotransferase class I/II-fold pyridoxal phosphate-dependent enzyme [Magnetofaba australis]OSM00204.1 putative 8-amino-7-oxononanoate synthase [Magnetofaba australis IT-1]